MSVIVKEKPHLSPTQVLMYARCGEQYRRRYMEGETIPPGIRMLIGSGFHRGAEVNMRQKIDSHEDLPVREVQEAAVAGFEERVQDDGYILSEEESSRGVKTVIGDATDEVARIAEVHAISQAPDYQPIDVERATRIILPHATHDLLGFTDLVDDQGRVVDFKTAGRKKNQNEVDTSLQLTVYAAAYQVDHGKPPSEVRLDVVTTTKTPARQVLSSVRDETDIQVLANRLNVVLSAIHAGVFTPASPGDWVCSPRWCGYWATCPYVNSERREAVKGEG